MMYFVVYTSSKQACTHHIRPLRRDDYERVIVFLFQCHCCLWFWYKLPDAYGRLLPTPLHDIQGGIYALLLCCLLLCCCGGIAYRGAHTVTSPVSCVAPFWTDRWRLAFFCAPFMRTSPTGTGSICAPFISPPEGNIDFVFLTIVRDDGMGCMPGIHDCCCLLFSR